MDHGPLSGDSFRVSGPAGVSHEVQADGSLPV